MSLFDDMFRIPIHRLTAFSDIVQLESNAPPPNGALTTDKLRSAMKLLDRVPATPRMVVSTQALRVVGCNFPPSRHRSRRIHKKLMRRYGDQYRYKPTSLQMGDTIIVHPALMAELQGGFAGKARDCHDRAVMSALYGIPVERR